jgi:hypothetical protein
MELHRILSDFHEVGQAYKEDFDRLDEAGLARLISWMTQYDCGTITAFRNKREEDDPVKPGEPYTRREKLQRNVQLLAELQDLRYNVTSVRGGYIENYGTPEAIPVHENTFFVVDQGGKGTLEIALRKLGEEWNQDSIMFIPKGGIKAILWGTSKKPDARPSYGEKWEMDTRKAGYKRVTQPDPKKPDKEIPVEGYNRPDPMYFTKKGNLPFFFESIYREHRLAEGMMGRWGVHMAAIRPWQNIAESHFISITEETLDE